jgi:hypothetical protein
VALRPRLLPGVRLLRWMVEGELSRGTGTVKRPAPRGSVRVSSGPGQPPAVNVRPYQDGEHRSQERPPQK